MPRAGFEPATTRSSAERSPRLSYLGGVRYLFKMRHSVLKFSDWFFGVWVLVWCFVFGFWAFYNLGREVSFNG